MWWGWGWRTGSAANGPPAAGGYLGPVDTQWQEPGRGGGEPAVTGKTVGGGTRRRMEGVGPGEAQRGVCSPGAQGLCRVSGLGVVNMVVR